MAKPFYKSRRWQSKRANILRRDEYLCRECRRYGKTTAATTVHHVFPLEQRPDLGLVSDNLISLCNEHHDKMHDRTNGELTDLGKQWEQRVSPLLQTRGFKV
ncbi:HNH endonuclease [Desulforamulus hydrothermalis]|uniref:HNH endonuclease n=1 Tax=Desulforamulus hydrothermalis TaxID=412895 RepID=UPI0009193613|nr:HNH endonuclease [Desulforamulus hydrothermalis]SHH37172.1 HNH endonuclease [Desulforamulus hydrothermalis Lam5 = DSM 18033]